MSKAGGILLSIIGGIISIVVFGIFIFVIYPEFLIFGRLFAIIFQSTMIVGGIITIIGAMISAFSKSLKSIKIAWITILVGAILGGGNILSIFGAIQIKKTSTD